MKRFFTFLLLCAAFQQSIAQVDLEVYVRDYMADATPSGITVLLANPDLGYSEQQITDARGRVLFKALPTVGNYTVLIPESELYLMAEKKDISLKNNTNVSVQMALVSKLNIAVLLSGVDVYSTALINTQNAEVSSALNRQEIETLPLEGRDITRLLYRLPNVVQATGFYPEAPNVGINGANGLYTNYMIDGMDNNERFLGGMKFNIPVGFSQDINVLTNNFSAQYGHTGNGVVNVTSRSGSNKLQAEAFFITRPGPAIDAASPYAQRDLSGNQVKDGFQRYQAGLGVGGALVKDKTFYYINAEYTRDIKDNLLRSPQLNLNETVRGSNNFSYFSARLDQHWNAYFKSSLRANLGLVNIARQGGGLDGGLAFPSAANAQDRNSLIIANQNTYVRDNFKSETNVQFARFRWNYARTANPSSPNVTVLAPNGEAVALLGHPGYLFDSKEETVQLQQRFSFYAQRHTIKAGLEVISSKHSLFGGGNPNGSYLVQLDSAQLNTLAASGIGANLGVNDIPSDVNVLNYNVELRPSSFGARQNIYSFYIEDTWNPVPGLNLNLGLRYDYDNLSKGGAAQGDFNNLAPRFSANYKLDSKSSIRMGYGMFYDKINYAIYSDALQQNTTSDDYKKQLAELVRLGILPASTDIDRIIFEGNLTASNASVTYLQGTPASDLQAQRDNAFSNERRILNPNGYQNPYTHQFSLGYQREIGKNLLFYVDLVHNRSHNLFRLRDLNAAAEYPIDPDNVVVRSVADANLSRPIPIANNTATINGEVLSGVARSVVMTETAGRSNYWGASFNLAKQQGNDKYSYRLIYTLSSLRNNTEDINFKAMDANNFEQEWGYGINDRRHVINGIFTYYPVKGLSFTLAALLQSGQPINRIPDAILYGTADLNGDGSSFADAYVGNSDRHPGEARNSDRLPWSNTFDLNGQYTFKLGKSSLSLRADVFNLFNAANLSGYSNNATQSNQIQVGSAASGLLVRRNASAPRQFQFSLLFNL
jgi:outer membrane receptor for ferrienterochelin and colicin